MIDMKAIKNASLALEMVLEASRGERIVIFTDDVRMDIARAFAYAGIELGLYVRLVTLTTKNIRTEVPAEVKEVVATGWADIYMNFFRGISEETPFRIKIIGFETRQKKRLAHCPGTNMDILLNGALALTKGDYEQMQQQAQRAIAFLNGAEEIEIRNPAGTNIKISVKGREFFTDTKINWQTMKWMNLPVGEVIVGPHEFEGNGVIVCDVAVGGIGPINTPVIIKVENGKAIDIKCKNRKIRDRIGNALMMDDMASHIGEFAFGLNPKARNIDEFVETEKINGTVHIAFGNNRDYPGGCNTSKNHMDFLISSPDVYVYFDGKSKAVMKNGKWVIP